MQQFRLATRLTSLVLCWIGMPAFAEEVRIAQQRGPYYVDEPMVIQIQVSGLEPEQQVACRLSEKPLPALSVVGPQLSQSTNSFTQIINGRITSSETVDMKFNFLVTASQEGTYQVGPFVVTVDSREQVLNATAIEFGQLEEDPDMQLEVSLPRKKIYVGEQVPVTIRWSFAGDRGDLQFAFSNLQIRSPLFDQFEFIDHPPTTRTTLSISTAQGVVEVDAEATQETRAGRDFVVVTGQRIMTPESPGDYAGIRVTSRTQRITGWSRDFFGRRRESKSALASAPPLSFTVIPLPSEGRPASFSGAVGSGFSMDVSVNRSVVRVGDPIALDITLKGNGNLEKLSLPPLAAGLNEDLFQLPSEIPAGTFAGNAKQFKINVRVKDKSVAQLPAIPFSWFDPQQEAFVTTTSRPIALQVMEAQLISADSVISSHKAEPSNSARDPVNGNSHTTNANAVKSLANSLSFVGANLAIEKRVPKLMTSAGGRLLEGWVIASLYVLGIVAVGIAFVLRRAGQETHEQLREKSAIKAARKEIRDAQSMPLRESTALLSSALRRLISQFPTGNRVEADQVIADCDRWFYAPSENDDPRVKSDLIARAFAAADLLTQNR